jgi:hypothetical protein
MAKNEYSEKIIERLEQFVAVHNDNFARLANAIGVSNGYFPRMRKVRGSIGADVLTRILIHYRDLSADWLLTGQGEMLKGKNSDKPRDVIDYRQRIWLGKKVLEEFRRIRKITDQFHRLGSDIAKMQLDFAYYKSIVDDEISGLAPEEKRLLNEFNAEQVLDGDEFDPDEMAKIDDAMALSTPVSPVPKNLSELKPIRI